MIQIKLLFSISFVALIGIYYYFLKTPQIVNIVFESLWYIFGVTIIYGIYKYFSFQLKDKEMFPIVGNLEYIPLKSTAMFFILFCGIDYYFEGGFIGMISLWFMYLWIALGVHFLTHLINFYKNCTMVYKEKCL